MKVLRIEHLMWSIICIASIFTHTYQMTDTCILPKWYFTISALLFGLCVLSIKQLLGKSIRINIIVVCYILIITCFVQALYGIEQWMCDISERNCCPVTGSFNNPAGFASCLCAGLPFAVICWKQVNAKLIKASVILMVLFIIIALIMSKSRTGIFSLVFMLILYVYNYLPFKRKCKIIILSLFLIICFLFLYFSRKDSANGRLLIWKNTWEMIKETPFLGKGPGAFRAHYMDFQANFFKDNIDSEYAMLADNVISPFNEYLSITLQYGLIGLLALLLFFLWLIYPFYKKASIDKRIALLSFSGIGVFSFFSYPFSYPFIWIIAFLDIWILCHERFKRTCIFSHKKFLSFLIIICCLKALNYLSLRIDAEYKWENIAYQHPTKEILSCYAKLLPIMERNPFFLYNYAIALSEAGYIEESLKRAQQCRCYWADYDLELLLGENMKRQRRYREAMLHYKNASMMCPCRFIPLYQLFEIYEEIGDKDKACSIALLILEKPVKVNSKVVMQIRYKVRNFLREECDLF